MNRVSRFLCNQVVSAAVKTTKANVNSTCTAFLHQDKLPESAKKLSNSNEEKNN